MDFELMGRLSEADGVSSQEEGIAEIMKDEFRKRGLKVEVDNFGNVLAYKSISKNPLVIAAHMDEIGLMAKHIDKKGFIRFIKIGGIDDRSLVNQQVLVKTRKGLVPGVIGSKAPHVMKPDERKGLLEYGNLFIDVGAADKKEAAALGIEIGNTVTFPTKFMRLGKKMISGKALDDRIGCYVLLELARQLPKNTILVGTTQEEVSTFGKGAKIASYRLDPGAFIAVDVTIAGDHPEMKLEDAPNELSKGPSIVLTEWAGRGNIADARLVQKTMECARKNRIKFQVDVFEGGATDAASVHNMKGGVPSIALCVPTRYIHSTVGVAHIDDIENCSKLLKKLIGTI
ncbi:M42 family metallopeptidase [Candidatus Micrarchaeota archaeon]|nr:M42 family metallopeptidase [Candidatus Micrarchaeota archaeon]